MLGAVGEGVVKSLASTNFMSAVLKAARGPLRNRELIKKLNQTDFGRPTIVQAPLPFGTGAQCPSV